MKNTPYFLGAAMPRNFRKNLIRNKRTIPVNSKLEAVIYIVLMATSVRPVRLIAVLKLKSSVPDLMTQMDGISAALAGNTTLYATPSPTCPIVNGLISSLRAKQLLVNAGTAGASGARDAAELLVRNAGDAWRGYIQGLADATPASAATIITTAMMKVRKELIINIPAIRFRKGADSLSVVLIAKSLGKNTSYKWQKSLDGTTWIDITDSTVCKITVPDLTFGETYYFRVRTTKGTDKSAWAEDEYVCNG